VQFTYTTRAPLTGQTGKQRRAVRPDYTRCFHIIVVVVFRAYLYEHDYRFSPCNTFLRFAQENTFFPFRIVIKIVITYDIIIIITTIIRVTL